MVILSQKKEMLDDYTIDIVESNSYNFSNNYEINLEIWERDFVYLLEFDNEVFRYHEKPLKLSNEKVQCIPSFLVRYHSMEKKDDLVYIDRIIDLNIKKLLKQFCLDNDLNLKIVLEETFREGYKLKNLKFLSNYMHADIKGNMVYIDFFLELFNSCHLISINDVMNKYGKEVQKKAEVLYVILHLISKGFFLINIDKKLTNNTMLSLNEF